MNPSTQQKVISLRQKMWQRINAIIEETERELHYILRGEL